VNMELLQFYYSGLSGSLWKEAAIQNTLPNGTCLAAYVAEVSECTDTFGKP